MVQLHRRGPDDARERVVAGAADGGVALIGELVNPVEPAGGQGGGGVHEAGAVDGEGGVGARQAGDPRQGGHDLQGDARRCPRPAPPSRSGPCSARRPGIRVPAALTADGETVTVPALPLLSSVAKTTPVDAVNPVPTRVMTWATSAEASAAFGGVPLSAAPAIAVSAGVGRRRRGRRRGDEDDAVGRGDQELPRGVERQPADPHHALRRQVHLLLHGPVGLAHLVDDARRRRAQPDCAARRVQGQAAVAAVHRRRRGELRQRQARLGVHHRHLAGRALQQVQLAGGRVVDARDGVEVVVQDQGGDDGAGGGVDGVNAVGVGVAVDHQQAARRHRRVALSVIACGRTCNPVRP